ncbi:YhdT family protein [Thalassobacillus sp. CUG 92003]|uniref:YhdT family protein n=1 Tax=Thalassobacillus sp. CUG 92003 TaxID=2736641 RepID=UPI0015E7380D|nr:YhdT family protein [Thalassobacillus sp. CUG 92003]
MKERQQDRRFRIAHREALIGVGLAVFNFIWWYGFAYGLGSKPPEEYSYVFGLPAWFFYSCVLGFVVMCILVIVVVKFWFVEVPLDDEPEDEGWDEQ